MKLYYFSDPNGNFGDDLNPWLWPKLIPEINSVEDADSWLVGIGTLLNHRLPATGDLHVMGSGVGYGDAMRKDTACHFHAVRGFKSAKALGLPNNAVVTDAAVLLRAVGVPHAGLPREKVGVMFTGRSLTNYDWESICQRLGYLFISCHWPVDKVLAEIQRCDVLITEAMHGAIVADALRVPWVPVTCSEGVLRFKWEDWLSSLQLIYHPTPITPLYDVDRHLDWRGRMKIEGKRWFVSAGLWRDNWGATPLPRRSSADNVDDACRQLVIAASRSGLLSSESLLDKHVQSFQHRIDRLRSAMHAKTARFGKFSR